MRAYQRPAQKSIFARSTHTSVTRTPYRAKNQPVSKIKLSKQDDLSNTQQTVLKTPQFNYNNSPTRPNSAEPEPVNDISHVRESDTAFIKIINEMSVNMTEINSDLAKLEGKCLSMDKNVAARKANLDAAKLQDDEFCILRNNNRKLVAVDQQLRSEFARATEQSSYLTSENELYAQKYANLREQSDNSDRYVSELQRYNAELGQSVSQSQNHLSALHTERDEARLAIRTRAEDVNAAESRLEFERLDVQKFKEALQLEIKGNEALELENQKMRLEMMNLKMIVDELKGHLEAMKANSKEALEYLKLSN